MSTAPRRRPRRATAALVAAVVAIGVAVLVAPATATARAATVLVAPATATARAATGQVALVQAVPGATVDVVVDGKTLRDGVAGRKVVGPIRLKPGKHTVAFRGDGAPVRADVQVAAGGNSDVVFHRPASVDERPVVTVYTTPDEPIAPGRSRVLLAHTALVPPADVELDGKTVFTNIANGEYATADVPAGKHEASLVLSGAGTNLLGPLPLDLGSDTATMIYAVGSPDAGSMDVVARTVRLRRDGTVAPTRVDTGSAGLVSDVHVRTFGPGTAGTS
ncbi:DUF4397 domain-containing protein [Solicola sp. PLA-1-18]|uniref:DUF4397 domain-containing protein n=1 Tax=Solicola sp. PLA-1-18 TaxID=3380532 RepID=UPI003B789916